MPTIFLSHTSIDKPFVERLAHDLERLGIRVWYDKYNIKVGESILWKIDEGIKTSEYLGIVISKEAWESEWVKTEVSAAWQKQISQHGNFILPIFYRNCDIPLFLQSIKYADFRNNYESGLKDLLTVFGIKDIEAITSDNWRKFTYKKKDYWESFAIEEFQALVTNVCNLAKEYRFSIWTGGTKSPYSFTLHTFISMQKQCYISVRMLPKSHYRYFVSFTNEINPNNIPLSYYKQDIGSTINEVTEFLWDKMNKFTEKNGYSTEQQYYHTHKFTSPEKSLKLIQAFVKQFNWDQDHT